MREDEYRKWLEEQEYAEKTQNAQVYRVKKVEENYGSLDEHFANNTYKEVISSLRYTTEDKRANKPNPSKIKFDGDIKNNLQSYRNSVEWYQNFLIACSKGLYSAETSKNSDDIIEVSYSGEDRQQKLSLERDMQKSLRYNIESLDKSLKIIDDGIERKVDSGFIDITCEDDDSLVVVELKAGKAPASAVTKILGYMGDLMEEDDTKPVRGILVAHDFDQRTKSAARAVPNLKLKKYAVEFKFMDTE